MRILAGIDFRNVGPGWAAKAVAQLEADVAAGRLMPEVMDELDPVIVRSRLSVTPISTSIPIR